jgi:hypothetical protein
VQFSQGQLREVLGISVETFRHWKRVLPPFADRKPYTPGYSMGDVLAAGVLHRLTDRCGVRAGHLAEISKTVVDICNANAWASLESRALLIDVQGNICRLVRNPDEVDAADVVIVCPLHQIMQAIQDGLARSQPVPVQRHFRFSPLAVGETRNQRRRA